MAKRDLHVGLMSGTSLDGVDAVVADFSRSPFRLVSHAHVPFDIGLREGLLALTTPGHDEIEQAGRLGTVLADVYAQAVRMALDAGSIDAARISAVGCHGQTIRHRPEQAFSIQIGNAALLAELTGLTVVADFRSRDLAAGGQGAPLVPAFHAAGFGDPAENRAVVNIGGIANITLLPRGSPVLGFDTGPGNCLMNLWSQRHLNQPMDAGGAWGAGGKALAPLLARMLEEPFFSRPAPKSTGRELFNKSWLEQLLDGSEDPRDVQATLLELTVENICRALDDAACSVARLIVCGGGARNDALMARLSERIAPRPAETSACYGLDCDQVEAAAFAWLAKRALQTETGNLPEVTGARGHRVLGAIYPA